LAAHDFAGLRNVSPAPSGILAPAQYRYTQNLVCTGIGNGTGRTATSLTYFFVKKNSFSKKIGLNLPAIF
jgi:hypothetical protein